MDLRSAAAAHDSLLLRRLDTIVPDLMERNGFEAWVITAREYNEDPVARTMLPASWLGTARRRTILVFTDHGQERAAISRYPVGPFPAAWDPDSDGDQWSALTEHLADVEGLVGIDSSAVFALADGLTSSEHRHLVRALDDHRLGPAESLALGWLETRLPEEAAAMSEACSIAHGFLRRALSNEVVGPGTTTTDDIAWWLAQVAHDSGHDIWFHPGVTVQRKGDDVVSPAAKPVSRTIVPGDLLHIDFGIVRNGYHTDQQQHAYVLGPDEREAPGSLRRGMHQANRLQDILLDQIRPGRSGNEVLAATLAAGRSEGLKPIVYTHPLGLHGHAAGATIGLWDSQEKVTGEGDYPVGRDTGWSIELAVEVEVSEWGGQTCRIMLEEDAFLSDSSVEFLDGRQEELWLIESGSSPELA